MSLTLLFSQRGELSEFLKHMKALLQGEIEKYESNHILNVSEEDLYQHLIDKYSLEPPVLQENSIYVHEPRDVDIKRGRSYGKGVSVIIVIPFDGNEDLFHYTPSTFTHSPPSGEIKNKEVNLTYQMIQHDEEKLKRSYTQDLSEIKRWLEWTKRDVEVFNNSLDSFIRNTVTQRKKKLLDDQKLVYNLGFPIKRCDKLPSTYTVPTIRRKPKIARPEVTKETFKPEPAHFAYSRISAWQSYYCCPVS